MAITAAAVKSLRERTGLPMMDCKKALTEAGGDEDKAVDLLRKQGAKVFAKRADRETSFGRMGIYASFDPPGGAMVELKCESAPVTKNEEFIQFANDLAKQLSTGPGATTAEELLAQPCPSNPDKTLGDVKDDMFNRIREVFNIGRMVSIDGPCSGYSHNASTVAGVLLELSAAAPEEATNAICMHVAAMRPSALKVADLDADAVAKEKEILSEAARQEGKPENIIEKMVEGRMRNYYAETVLNEQQIVGPEAVIGSDKKTVGKFAEGHGFQIEQFVHWELG